MTQTPSDEAERFHAAALITHNPEKYKVCEGCGSILANRVAICPLCSAYRFNDKPSDVVKNAWELANNPPTTIFK